MATRKVKAWVEPSGLCDLPTHAGVSSHFHEGKDAVVFMVFKTRKDARDFYGGVSGAVRATLTYDDGQKKRAPKRARKEA